MYCRCGLCRLHKSFIDARVAYHRAKEQSYVQQVSSMHGCRTTLHYEVLQLHIVAVVVCRNDHVWAGAVSKDRHEASCSRLNTLPLLKILEQSYKCCTAKLLVKLLVSMAV